MNTPLNENRPRCVPMEVIALLLAQEPERRLEVSFSYAHQPETIYEGVLLDISGRSGLMVYVRSDQQPTLVHQPTLVRLNLLDMITIRISGGSEWTYRHMRDWSLAEMKRVVPPGTGA